MDSIQTKKIIKVQVGDIPPYELSISALDIIKLFKKIVKDHGPTATLEYDGQFHYAYESSPSPRFIITICREETDTEFTKRLEQEKLSKEAREERDRKELIRLEKYFAEKKWNH